jgi:hypothetical protein
MRLKYLTLIVLSFWLLREPIWNVSAETAGKPEARIWLKENKSRFCALATNRFGDREAAIEFVEELYEMGAVEVKVDNVMSEKWRIDEEGGPYADTLIVKLPKNSKQRADIFKLQKKEVDSTELIENDTGQDEIIFWWD